MDFTRSVCLAFCLLFMAASVCLAQDDGLVAVETRELKLNGKRIHLLEAGQGPAVLLLHGARFSSQTWRELGTVELLARQGFRVLAPDLPGYGESEASDIAPERFLASILPLIADRPVAVVSPSMSGSFAFPLLERRPSFVTGFVAVAPVGISESLDVLSGSRLDALVIWGGKDKVVAPKLSRALADALPNSRRVEIAGASHACYLDEPAIFHRELLTFLKGLEHRPPGG